MNRIFGIAVKLLRNPMPSLILTGNTSKVSVESKHIVVEKRDEKGKKTVKTHVPMFDIERVLVIGRPYVTLPTLQRIVRKGIPINFITTYGRWIGAMTSNDNMDAIRRIKQYECYGDEKRNLEIARKLIYAKLMNSRRVLQRLSANRKESQTHVQVSACNFLKNLANQARSVNNKMALRGIEGSAAARYFERLSDFFPAEIPFTVRTRRPPKDEANAIMSWTYTILYGEIETAIRSQGLDPCIGFMHETSHGTPSLALDLMEPLRSPVCDLLILNLLNHHSFKKEDFRLDLETGGVFLKQESQRKFFINYEAAMSRKFRLSKTEDHIDFRQIIRKQIFTVLHYLEGVESEDFFILP